jgi:hypothetical protein
VASGCPPFENRERWGSFGRGGAKVSRSSVSSVVVVGGLVVATPPKLRTRSKSQAGLQLGIPPFAKNAKDGELCDAALPSRRARTICLDAAPEFLLITLASLINTTQPLRKIRQLDRLRDASEASETEARVFMGSLRHGCKPYPSRTHFMRRLRNDPASIGAGLSGRLGRGSIRFWCGRSGCGSRGPGLLLR